ncbi:MAG: nitroreductase family protein [Candidatus Methanomethylicaceae archaeon]
MRERHSTRAPFDRNRSVARKDLAQILESARCAPTPHNMQNFEIVVVSDKKLLGAISSIESPISDEFIRENYQQLSFSETELRRRKVGLLGTMFPAFMRNPEGKLDARKKRTMSSQESLVKTGPVLLVVVFDPAKRAPASEGDFLGIMGLGCVMENMWLAAQSLGLAFHVVSSLGEAPVEAEVKRLLQIPKNLRIAFGARLGYPTSVPRRQLRVRRDMEDFVHHNQYDKS